MICVIARDPVLHVAYVVELIVVLSRTLVGKMSWKDIDYGVIPPAMSQTYKSEGDSLFNVLVLSVLHVC